MRDDFSIHTLPTWASYSSIINMVAMFFIITKSIGSDPVYSLPIVLMFCALYALTVYLAHITNKDNEKKDDYALV